MATLYANPPSLLHATLRRAAGDKPFHTFTALCDEVTISPQLQPLFTDISGVPADYRYQGDTVSFRLVGPADALPTRDTLARQLALAVLAGDMVAALVLADRVTEHYATEAR